MRFFPPFNPVKFNLRFLGKIIDEAAESSNLRFAMSTSFLRRVLTVGLIVAGLAAWSQVITVYPNQDFEAPELGLGLWPENTLSTLNIDREVGGAGKQALRIDAPNPDQRAFVLMSVQPPAEVFPPETFFMTSVLVRKSPGIDNRAITYRINFRVPDDAKQEPGKIVSTAVPICKKIIPLGNGWEKWLGYFKVPKGDYSWQFQLGVENTQGSVWFDDIVFEKVDLQLAKPDVWTNWTLGVKTGSTTLERWRKHNDAKDAVYHAGKRYNALLWQSAELEANLRGAERAAAYTGRPITSEREAFADAEQLLQAMYAAYDTAFISGKDDDWKAFQQAADQFGDALNDLDTSLKSFWSTTPIAGLPPHFGPASRDQKALEGDGRMNRLLIGVWSPGQFVEAEKPFCFEFHSAGPCQPAVHTEAKRDFSNITAAGNGHAANGFAGTFAYLDFATHDQMYAPAWFYEKYKDDPDFARVSWDGQVANHRSKCSYCLNFFHPAVKQYINDYLGEYAAFCAKEPRILFYEFAAETLMNFKTKAGARSIGYGKHATMAFQEHLRRRYQDIGAVNAALGTTFADFNAAEQPPDPLAKKRETVTPLDAEFEIFRENSYMDYLRSINLAIKAADQDKPTVARFNGLISDMNGARAFDVCDIVSHHCRAPRMQMVYPYLNSMNRHYKRGLAYMEDFWGCQDAQDRVDEECAQRRGLEKHVARSLIWGRTLQMKWHSYTPDAYLFTYNSNWMSLRHDLTTMRYCAPALGITLRNMENFDWVLTHSAIALGRILLLQPSATMRNLRPSRGVANGMQRFHNFLQDNGFVYESLPEEFIQDGRVALGDFDVVLLPQALYMPIALQAQLANFVNNGGTLVALTDLPAADELARPTDAFQWTLKTAVAGRELQADGKAWATETRHAKGHLLKIAPGAGFGSGAPGAELAALLKERAGRAAWADGDVMEVILRHAEDGNDYLFVQNPDLDHARTATLRFTVPCAQLIDASLPGGVALPMSLDGKAKSARIRLGPAETAVLWLKRPANHSRIRPIELFPGGDNSSTIYRLSLPEALP